MLFVAVTEPRSVQIQYLYNRGSLYQEPDVKVCTGTAKTTHQTYIILTHSTYMSHIVQVAEKGVNHSTSTTYSLVSSRVLYPR